MSGVVHPMSNVAATMVSNIMAPLYDTVANVRPGPMAALTAIQNGRTDMMIGNSAPYDPLTQEAILPKITTKTYNKFFESLTARKLLTDVMPLQAANPSSNEISWYQVRFDPQLADEVSPLVLGRNIGYERTARTQRLRLYRVGYSFDNDTLRHPDGQALVLDVIAHIGNVQLDTACAIGVNALLNAVDQYRLFRAKEFQVQPHTLRQILDEEVGLFDILHQDNGVRIMRDHMKEVFNRQRGNFRYLLLPEEIEQQIRGSPSESEYYRAGAPAIANRNSSFPLTEVATIPTFPAFGNVETILIKTNYTNRLLANGSIGLLQQIVQIGEYYLLRYQPNSSAEKDYRSNNIKIYDGQNNCYTMIDFMDAVDQAMIFGDNGAPLVANDAKYSQGASDIPFGNIADVIWDANGIPRSTHGQIPEEYLPHGHVTLFANTLAKIFEQRRIGGQLYQELETLISTTINRAAATFTPAGKSKPLGKVVLDIIQFNDGTKPQGVSYDDLEGGAQGMLNSFAGQVMSFFPNNVMLGDNTAPLWSYARGAGAALWENLIVPYYPPVLASQKAGTANEAALATLGLVSGDAPEVIKLVTTIWALSGGDNRTYETNLKKVTNGADAGASIAAIQANPAGFEEEVSKMVRALSPAAKANFDRLFDIYELLEQESGDGYVFTTMRKTPGLVLPAGTVGGYEFFESNPEMPLVPKTAIQTRFHPQINAFAVNEALKHHISAAQSDAADNYMRKRPTGLVGEIYNAGAHLQSEVRKLLGGKRVVAMDDLLYVVEGPRSVKSMLGGGLSLRGLFSALFLSEAIHRETWSRWAAEGLPMPVSIMIARPTISVLTSSIIACNGGAQDGGVYYKPSASRSGVHVRGDVTAQVQFELGGVVKNPENVYTFRNALVLRVLRGHNTKFFKPEAFKAGPSSWFSGIDASLLAFMVPASMESTRMISLSGSFDHRGVHNYRDFNYIPSDGGFVGADRANAMYNFKRIAEMRRFGNEEDSDAYNINVLCFPGQTWYFNAATQQFSNCSPGTGHFGNTDGPDASLVRSRQRFTYASPPLCV
jgi:hypothetical protein